MKKIKLAAVIFFIATVISVNIFSTVNAEEELPRIFLSSANAGENQLTEITVNFDGNVDISAFSIEILFNPENLVFIEAQKGNALNSGTFYYNSFSEDSVRLVWSDGKDSSVNGVAAKLVFKTKNSNGAVPVYIGYSMLGNENLQELEFETGNGEIRIYSDYLKGDVSGDGKIDSTDIILLNKYLISKELYPIGEDLLVNADMDYDGNINSKDGMDMINLIIFKDWNKNEN